MIAKRINTFLFLAVFFSVFIFTFAIARQAEAGVVGGTNGCGSLSCNASCSGNTNWTGPSGTYFQYVQWSPGGIGTQTSKIDIYINGGLAASAYRDGGNGTGQEGLYRSGSSYTIRNSQDNNTDKCFINWATIYYQYCSPSSVANGTVAAAPNCGITCNANYYWNGSSCVLRPCNPSSIANGTVGPPPNCTKNCNAFYVWNGSSCVPTDVTPPTASISPGTAGAWYYSTIPFSYTANWADNGSGLANCSIYIDGAWYAIGCGGASKAYTASLAAGNHSLLLYAADRVGRTAYSSWYYYGITYPVPTLTFSASPNPVGYNAASTLTWSSTNATSCTASGSWSGAKVLSGSQLTGNLTAANTYTLTCSGLGGSITKSVAVSIGAPTASITANNVAVSTTATYNTAATIRWSSTNATSCTGTNFSTGGATNNATGVSTGTLYGTKTYYIYCDGPGGRSPTVNVVVHVSPIYSYCSGAACMSATGIEGVVYSNLCSNNTMTAISCGGGGGGGGSGSSWHSICANNQCVVVNGAGTNQCSTNLNCAGSYPAQYYGVCAQGTCVMVSGTNAYATSRGISSCSNYGGTCPNPAGSSYNITSSNDLKLNITKQTGTVTSNNTTLIVVEPLSGFSDTVNLSVNDWGGLATYAPIANFSKTSLTSTQYSSGATLSVSVPVTVPSNNYFIVVRGTGAASGKVIDRTIKVILYNAASSTWREI